MRKLLHALRVKKDRLFCKLGRHPWDQYFSGKPFKCRVCGKIVSIDSQGNLF